MRDRRYHWPISYDPVDTVRMPADLAKRIPAIRSYVFAFEMSDFLTQDLKRLAERMADYSKTLDQSGV